jgi:hypothetical protein
VRITDPRWWTTFNPKDSPTFDVKGHIYARGRPFTWQLEIGFGVEPNENEYQVVAKGAGQQPIDGKIATLDIMNYVNDSWLRRTPQNTNDFTVILRLRAFWSPSKSETVEGQIRKEVAWHIDDDPATGLLPGFPIHTGASGASSPIIYDMDGDPDGRYEIIFATALPTVEVYKYNATTKTWAPMPGFPVQIPPAPGHAYNDSIAASLAVGPVYGDGVPYIVAATNQAQVYMIHPDGNLHAGGPFVKGFPVSAAAPDNSSPLSYAHGNGFLSSPVLADLDNDGIMEIIAGSYDQHVYVWKVGEAPGDGKVALMPGWPVKLSSTAADHLVGPEYICESNSPAEILTTPAVAILDPNHANPDIAFHPSIVVGSTETCTNSMLPTSRLYAIYWNGMDNANGPFLPGWPAIITTPSGNSIPIPPLTIGVTSSPAIAWSHGDLTISTGSFFWFPQLVFWDGQTVGVRALWSDVNLGDAANGSFAKFDDSGELWYLYPTAGFLQKVPNDGVRLIAFGIVGWRMDHLQAPMFRKKLDDINFFLNPVVAAVGSDNTNQMLSGSGGYLLHAVDVKLNEATGFPKYTQNWNTSSPAVGDLMGDGTLDVVAVTQEGNFFAWKTKGKACVNNAMNAEWGRFHHDSYNSGVYGYDAFPPRLVRDLHAYANGSAGSIELQFTAPGDDGDCGRPASYDIRYTTKSGADLRDPAVWATASAVPAPDPAMGGEKIDLNVEAPNAVAFAMRAYDKMGLMSPISNMATIENGPPPSDDDDDNDAADDDATDDDSSAHYGDDDNESGLTTPAKEHSNAGCGC